MADLFPCRILGDPLQAIFDFEDGKPVDWNASVYPTFDCLGELDTPWRWKQAEAHELGAWLKEARKKIELGQKIDLVGGLPRSVIRVATATAFLEAKQYSSLCDQLGRHCINSQPPPPLAH